jgi:2-oxoglutarate dehydrogenase E2 component (dihydrolipoamide succinyltransferase)
MPQLGESVVEGKVSRWLKRQGDAVQQYEPLLEVETDKVTTEVTAVEGGVLLKVLVAEGLTVKASTPLAIIGQPGEAMAETDSAQSAPVERNPRISPVVARIAAEHKVDVSQIRGTGEGGRVTKKDILEFVEGQAQSVERKEELPPWEQPGSGDLFKPTEESGPSALAPLSIQHSTLDIRHSALPGDELLPLSAMRRSIAEHMVKSKTVSAHVTTIFEADLSRVVAHRDAHKAAFERDGAKLTFTPYFIAASVAALKAYPRVNSSFTEDGLLIHKQINIGVAVSLGEEGLIVPVVKGADGLSLLGLARAVNDLAERARNKQLKPDDVTGSTFTLTNHGVSGSLFATPIINQPNVGILGVGAIQKRAVVINDAIAIRPMVYLGLTFDHRVLDGASADWFVAEIVQVLENWN